MAPTFSFLGSIIAYFFKKYILWLSSSFNISKIVLTKTHKMSKYHHSYNEQEILNIPSRNGTSKQFEIFTFWLLICCFLVHKSGQCRTWLQRTNSRSRWKSSYWLNYERWNKAFKNHDTFMSCSKSNLFSSNSFTLAGLKLNFLLKSVCKKKGTIFNENKPIIIFPSNVTSDFVWLSFPFSGCFFKRSLVLDYGVRDLKTEIFFYFTHLFFG